MKTLITTVVDSKYMAYLPIFVYCFKKAYPTPDFDIKLFVRDKCKYKVDCELIHIFHGFPEYKYNSIALRFVVPPEYYKWYDCVYITDIDMLLMTENPTLDAFHWKEMNETKLCYSNSLRNKDHYMGYQSLSGLHYATQEWFERTEKDRNMYYDLLKSGIVGLYREYDGVMLYRMCEKIGLPQKYKLIKRHHGIHLGNFRLFDSKEKWADRIPMEFRINWIRLQEKQQFRDILTECRQDNKMLDDQLTMLDNFIRG